MTFSEIKSLFEKVKANNPEAANLTLEEFAQMGARSTGDPEMSRIGQASPWENLIRTANQKLNEGIAALTPDETLGNVTGSLAEMVGVDRAVGEQVGRSLPRQAINVAAMGVPGVGPALSFGLSAADAFDQTGSMWQTAIAGAAPMVVGKAMNVGGNAALQAAAKSPAFQRLGVTGGREVVRDVTGEAAKFLPIGTKTVDTVIDQLPDKLVRFAGAELAGQATGLGLDVAAQGTDAVFNKDYLFSNLIGNLAFAPLNIGDFIGTKTLESGRLVLPPEPGPTRTPSEQRAFEFESLLSSLSPSEKTRAERAAGFDIAAQLLGERRLTQINKDLDDQLSKERTLLENDWVALQEKEPAVAGVKLEDAMADIEKLNVVAPESRERIERFQLKLKELDDVKKARLNELKSVGRTTDLLGVSIDELNLPEGLLQKSADQREFTDYKAALDGKVSERGQQVIYAIHKLAAGKREDLMAGPHKEVAEEVEKVLQGKGTKFADDRAFVSMALWATGRRPLSDVQVKAKVEKKVKEGKTTKEAVTEVNQEELVKVDGALRQEEMLKQLEPGKKKGRPEGLAKATLEKIDKSEARIQNGLQSGDVTQRDFYAKVQASISEIDDADPNVNAKLMAEVDKQLSMTADKGVPLDRALEMLKLKLGQVKVAFARDQVAKGKVGEQSQELVDVAAETKSPVSEDLDQLVYLRDQLGLEKLSSETVNEAALRLMERGMTPKVVKAIKDNIDLPIVKDLLRVMNELKVPPLFNEKGMLKVQYTEFINFMHEMMKKESPQLKKEAVILELKEMNVATQNKAWLLYQQWKKEGKPAVKDVVGFKFARSEGANSDFAVHSLMSLDQWSDALLRSEGFSPEEVKELREHFANAVEMFYSPEVRYGKMSEAKDNLLFARDAQVYESLSMGSRYKGLVSKNTKEGELPFRFTEFFLVPETGELKPQRHVSFKTEAEAHDYAQGYRWRIFENDQPLETAKGVIDTVDEEAAKSRINVLKYNPHFENKNLSYKKVLVNEEAYGIKETTAGSAKDLLFARAPAGGGFEFGMAEFKDGKLLRPGKGAVTPRKDGTLSLQEFKVAGGQLGPLTDAEIEFYKQLVPEAFADGKVHLQKLWDGLNKVGESVKVDVYGQDGQASEAKQQLDKLTHDWWDTLPAHQRVQYTTIVEKLGTKQLSASDLTPLQWSPEAVAKALQFDDLQQRVTAEPKDTGPRATSYYNQISPFDTKKYPVVRVDVSLPPRMGKVRTAAEFGMSDREYDRMLDKREQLDPTLWEPDNLHENLPNTLGWAMVQFVPDPKTGETVAFVGEQQSRWGQEVQKKQSKAHQASRPWLVYSDEFPRGIDVTGVSESEAITNARREANTELTNPRAQDNSSDYFKGPSKHPLLDAQANLVLKAVIREAQKRGVKKVVISDGETAMMTEGHDVNSRITVYTEKPSNIEAVKGWKWEEQKGFGLVKVPFKLTGRIHWTKEGPPLLETLVGNPNQKADKEFLSQPGHPEGRPYRTAQGQDVTYKTLGELPKELRNLPELIALKGQQAVSQEGGMRLHYDTTLPSVMKKLTGGEGEMWDGGVHKNAVGDINEARHFEDATITNPGDSNFRVGQVVPFNEFKEVERTLIDAGLLPPEGENRNPVTGSPVFRNPDGTPKASVTGRIYDITTPSERINTLFARSAPQAYAAAATRTRDIFFSPSALKGRNLILQQTSLLTHENSHILFSKARSGSFGPEAQRLTSDFETWAKTLNPHEAETFVDVLSDVWLGKEWKALPGVGDVLKNIRNERGDVDVEEVMANVFGAYAAGLSKPSNPTKFYTMMPRVVRDMFDWVARMMQGVVGAARMYGKFGGDVSKVKQARKVKEVFDAVRRGARNAERNLADLAELANLRQSDVLDKVDVMYAKGRYGSTGEGKWKERLSYLFDNTIMRMGSLAATYDGLQDPFMKMKDFSPLNADLTAQVFSSLGMGKYGHTGLSVTKDGSWMRIRNSPELHKLASQINLESQMLNKNLVTKNADGSLAFSVADMSPELRSKFGMFRPEAQQAVAEYFVRRAEKANKIVQGVIVSKEWETQANKLHELLFESNYTDFSGQFEKSKLWSEKVMKMAQNGDDAGVAAELGKISDTVAQKQLSDYISAQSSKIRFLDEEYKKNPNFGSLRRFQPIKVKWIKPGEEAKNMQANTAEEAERMDAQLRAQGWTPQSVRITDFKAKGSDVFDSNTKLRVRDMEERVKLALKNMAVPEEFKAELEKEIDFVGMIERTENAQSVFSTKAQRRFAEGVEDLMVLEQDMLWMSKAIYAANRAALDSSVRVALKNPKLDDYLDAKKTFAQGYENFKTQNHDWLSKLSKANAAYFIGFNLPGHFAELMQPVMTHLAEMRYAGVKTQDALGIMLGASRDLVSFYKRNMKKFAKGEEVHLWDDWKNPEERDMLFRMKHAINASPLNYAYQDVGFEQQKLIEAAELGKKQSLMQAVGSPVSAYANIGLKFYGLFTRHNAIMGLLNGYRSYRKLGLSHEEAIEKTGLFETIVNKSGGKADRQAFPFKNNAVLGHLFYGLQGYTTGWISQLATYYRHGYKSDGYVGFKNNPEAIKRARNAFKTMLIAQFAAAGAMGMPLVGAMTTLLEEITGEDIKGEMYEALDQVTNDPLLSQAASHGLSTALAERLGIPADLHGRFAIGGLLGFNAYDGFSASSLLGPTAGMINSMWNLGKTFAEERDLQKALEAGGPTGLRSIAKALDEELPLRNENALSTALGFNSTQTRKEREFTRIAQKRNEKAAREISHAARRVQEALSLGSSAAQQTLRNEAMKLAESPDQLESLIRSIGNKVKLFEEQRTLPKDIREVATPQTAAGLSELAKAMGVRLPASQEVDRELLKQDVMRRMGLSSASRVRQAMQADYLAEMNPWSVR